MMPQGDGGGDYAVRVFPHNRIFPHISAYFSHNRIFFPYRGLAWSPPPPAGRTPNVQWGSVAAGDTLRWHPRFVSLPDPEAVRDTDPPAEENAWCVWVDRPQRFMGTK